jgi:hypothetical protein
MPEYSSEIDYEENRLNTIVIRILCYQPFFWTNAEIEEAE